MRKSGSVAIDPSKLPPKAVIEDGLFTIDMIEKYYPDHFFKFYMDDGYGITSFEGYFFPSYQKI
jgi:hypothetical protein